MSWERAFLAMSVTLGESSADALAALGEPPGLRSSPLMTASNRQERAHALARELAVVVTSIAALETTWA